MLRDHKQLCAQNTHTSACRPRIGCPGLYVEDAFAAPDLVLDSASGGDLVIIIRINQTGEVVIEGVAYRGARTGRHPLEHWVLFVGEHRCRRRLVLPGVFQSFPEAIVEGMNTLYADAGSPDTPDIFLSDLIRQDAANDNHPASEEEA